MISVQNDDRSRPEWHKLLKKFVSRLVQITLNKRFCTILFLLLCPQRGRSMKAVLNIPLKNRSQTSIVFNLLSSSILAEIHEGSSLFKQYFSMHSFLNVSKAMILSAILFLKITLLSVLCFHMQHFSLQSSFSKPTSYCSWILCLSENWEVMQCMKSSVLYGVLV